MLEKDPTVNDGGRFPPLKVCSGRTSYIEVPSNDEFLFGDKGSPDVYSDKVITSFRKVLAYDFFDMIAKIHSSVIMKNFLFGDISLNGVVGESDQNGYFFVTDLEKGRATPSIDYTFGNILFKERKSFEDDLHGKRMQGILDDAGRNLEAHLTPHETKCLWFEREDNDYVPVEIYPSNSPEVVDLNSFRRFNNELRFHRDAKDIPVRGKNIQHKKMKRLLLSHFSRKYNSPQWKLALNNSRKIRDTFVRQRKSIEGHLKEFGMIS